MSIPSGRNHPKWNFALRLLTLLLLTQPETSLAYSNEFEKTEQFMEKFNLEQNLAAIFNKVAYGGTTKRSIPENSYPVTTLATPLLTTYRYSDGSNEWLSVDVKKPDTPRSGYDYEDSIRREENYETNYGADLEKDHVLPTSAPAADILKNNNNKNYENPNRLALIYLFFIIYLFIFFLDTTMID